MKGIRPDAKRLPLLCRKIRDGLGGLAVDHPIERPKRKAEVEPLRLSEQVTSKLPHRLKQDGFKRSSLPTERYGSVEILTQPLGKQADSVGSELYMMVLCRDEVRLAVKSATRDGLNDGQVDEPAERLLKIVNGRELRGRSLIQPADRRFEPYGVDRMPNSPFKEEVAEVGERVDGVGR